MIASESRRAWCPHLQQHSGRRAGTAPPINSAMRLWFCLVSILVIYFSVPMAAQNVPQSDRSLSVTLNLNNATGPMEIERFSLAQGGLSDDPMWANRTAEIRGLRVKLIRTFVQEYFNLLPQHGRYDFAKLDETVDTVRQAGAEPLMDLTIRPNLLYPSRDPKVIYPNSWDEWDNLIYELVKHYKGRDAGIKYWEVGDECDIGALSGAPYDCTPENYAIYYQHTIKAIRRADPYAKVGGPTAARYDTPVLTYLVAYCAKNHVPLDFVSWHVYSNDPQVFRKTVGYVKEVLAKYPSIHPQTFLDEWNDDLSQPLLDPRFQPCFITEVAYQMKEAGIDYMAYYQIRDYHIVPEQFLEFMTPKFTAFMDRYWNRRVQVDGLFDFQNEIRPSFFAFKMLSQLTGERLPFDTNDKAVHGLASWDKTLELYNLLIWNFSDSSVQVSLALEGGPSTPLVLSPRILNATAESNAENVRLMPIHSTHLDEGDRRVKIGLGPYAVELLTLAPDGYLNY